jgi:squalene synthase HpnC
VLDAAGATAPAKASSENFPVALRLLPQQVRSELLAIYGYARAVDDIGDEFGPDTLSVLDEAEADLRRVFLDGPRSPVFAPLPAIVRAHGIPIDPFLRLIEANRVDQQGARYDTFQDLLNYCELSANPVGELVLYLFDAADGEHIALSDRICAALQILEHLQDIGEDFRRGRVYLPARDMRWFDCPASDLAKPYAPARLRALIEFQTRRAHTMMRSGEPLLDLLSGPARLAVAGYLAGGYATVEALRRSRYEVLGTRVRPSPARTALSMARLLAAHRGRRHGRR